MNEPAAKTNVEQLYDELSGDFWKWTPSPRFVAAYEQTVGAALRRHPAGSALGVAELGCGHGTWLKRCAEDAAAAGCRLRALGVDLSTERLARAPEYLAGIVDIELVHGELVSFAPRGRFHVVYAFEVFQYLSYAEQLQVLERWLPHLEPGGSLVVLDKDRYSRHALICELQKVLGPLDFVLGRLRKFPPHYRALFRTIHYPDFRRLAAHFRGRTRLEVRVARHAEFSSLTLRRG